MQAAGLWMLAAVVVLLPLTGLPAWVVLIGVAISFAATGVVAGAFPAEVLTALYPRLVGLLENDLLQALPLYVLMGALLNRLPLADGLLRVGTRALAWTGSLSISKRAATSKSNVAVGADPGTLPNVMSPVRWSMPEGTTGNPPTLMATVPTTGLVIVRTCSYPAMV